MSKVICDICGTTYPATSACCPICGSVQVSSEDSSAMPELNIKSAATDKKKSLFSDILTEEFYDCEETEEEEISGDMTDMSPVSAPPIVYRTNWTLVVMLILVICILLCITGFLFFKYYLPAKTTVASPSQTTIETTAPVVTEETTAPTVPCSSIVLTAGVPELTRIGQYWLLHTIVLPENTTDTVSFLSADERVVTVTPEGRLCAVGEGETTVIISCGKEEILCQVVVKLPVEGERPSDEVDVEAQNAQGDRPVDTAEPATQSGQGPDTDVVLKLEESDISFTNSKKGITYQLKLDCDLLPEDVEWYTMDPNVALCHNGVITIIGQGNTKIGVKYKDQEVFCIVRVTIQ